VRTLLRRLRIPAALLLLAGLAFAVPTLWGKPWKIEHYYLRVLAEFALEHPMLLSYARVLEPYGLDFHSDDLEDLSIEAQVQLQDQVEEFLEGLREYDRADQTHEQLLSTDVLEWFLQVQADRRPFLFHGYPVEQMDGWQSSLPDFMLNIHQVETAGDAENYVARLEKFGALFDDLTESLRYREERGIVPPRFVLAGSRQQVAELLAAPADEHVLYTHLADRLEAAGIAGAERDALLESAQSALDESVFPGYRRLDAFLAEQELRATDDDGVWKLPDGDAYYRWALRYHTTTELDPEEIHALGLSEVARLRGEMRTVLAEAGIDTTEPIGALDALARDPRFLFPDSDAGRDQILESYREIVGEARDRLPELFGRLPDAPVTVERVPVFKEEGSPGAYYQPPSFDGSRPGTFYANLRSVEETSRFNMRTLAYHEAIPGHHLQLALAIEQSDLPFFRRVIPFTAYMEGWALYAETLADEAGWHPTPYDRLGKLIAEIFRAARLVVDTGIHWKRWTREEAITYMRANTGMAETDVVAEIERYIVLPGQACAYKVGQLEILRLRETARAALGADFDLRAFNDLILEGGAMPLVVLERVVLEWIEARKVPKGAK
jgi:uncharacterized protein (DUF885 family)